VSENDRINTKWSITVKQFKTNDLIQRNMHMKHFYVFYRNHHLAYVSWVPACVFRIHKQEVFTNPVIAKRFERVEHFLRMCVKKSYHIPCDVNQIARDILPKISPKKIAKNHSFWLVR